MHNGPRVGLLGAKCVGPVGRGLFVTAPRLGVLTCGAAHTPWRAQAAWCMAGSMVLRLSPPLISVMLRTR
jgi:hypothetical protein